MRTRWSSPRKGSEKKRRNKEAIQNTKRGYSQRETETEPSPYSSMSLSCITLRSSDSALPLSSAPCAPAPPPCICSKSWPSSSRLSRGVYACCSPRRFCRSRAREPRIRFALSYVLRTSSFPSPPTGACSECKYSPRPACAGVTWPESEPGSLPLLPGVMGSCRMACIVCRVCRRLLILEYSCGGSGSFPGVGGRDTCEGGE